MGQSDPGSQYQGGVNLNQLRPTFHKFRSASAGDVPILGGQLPSFETASRLGCENRKVRVNFAF